MLSAFVLNVFARSFLVCL